MEGFHYRDKELYCEDVAIKDLVRQFGSPLYVYSYNTFTTNFKRIKDAFSDMDTLIAYSVKANSNISICKTLIQMGAGADIVSGGELERALRAGAEPQKIVYAGVGKTHAEIDLALKSNIFIFNVESLPEAYLINEIAKINDKKAAISLRVNPDVDACTHKYINTGKKETKFGINYDEIEEIVAEIKELENIDLIGIHCHIGSQILKIEPYLAAIQRVKELILLLKEKFGITITVLNLGGGFGIAYRDNEQAFDIETFAEKVKPLIKDLHCKLIFEPGRFIIGPAGALITKVIYVKQTRTKTFTIVDAAMNDLIRPSLYSAFHRVLPVDKHHEAKVVKMDIVGPVCESGDFLAKDYELPLPGMNQLLAILDAGAYGYVMASNYNSRPRPAEILVKDNHYAKIRVRETLDDIVKGERIPEFLQIPAGKPKVEKGTKITA